MTPEEFRSIRRTLDETQTTLARRLGVTLRTVQRWEAGAYKVPPMAAQLLERLEREASHVD